MNKEHYDCIIIGGGVAGLCAAIELCRRGITPLIIEAGCYPSHKVCGEFLSPESLSWLRELKIDPVQIKNVHFHIEDKSIDFIFPMPAGGLSHWMLDPSLAECAKSYGAKMLLQVKVEAFHPKQKSADPHVLELSTGKSISANSLIVAAGRLAGISSAPARCQYVGIKAHFEGIELNQSLKMFGFNGAYLGLSQIEEGKANLACLATMQRVESAGSIDQLMADLIAESDHLKGLLSKGTRIFDQWMSAPVPFFGFKQTPEWKDAYFIGDAALGIPPACGEGLSLAVSSGIMAAQYVSRSDSAGFKKSLHSWCAKPLRFAKVLNYLLMHPGLGKMAIGGFNLRPSLMQWLFRASRQPKLPS